MKKPMTARSKDAKFNQIIEGHAIWEKRTLADLRVLGYRFTTVAQAFSYAAAQKTLAAMTHEEVVKTVTALAETRKPQRKHEFTDTQLAVAMAALNGKK